MLDDFVIRALLAGLAVALATGALGCFVVWRRMAYFGDSVSHAAILGVAISIALNAPLHLGVLAVALTMAGLVTVLMSRGYAADTVLGVLSHGTLAFGLVGASLVPGLRVDLTAFLFGDILFVSRPELALIALGAVVVLALLIWRWQRLVTATVNEDLALAAGIDPRTERLILAVALAVVVAVAIRVVGALLISAMLIVPAAAARPLSRTPETMAVIATVIGALSVLGGLGASLRLDLPAGPAIIVAAAIIFALSAPLRRN